MRMEDTYLSHRDTSLILENEWAPSEPALRTIRVHISQPLRFDDVINFCRETGEVVSNNNYYC